MPSKKSLDIPNVNRDPNLFVWFMTLVIGITYALSLYNDPGIRQWGALVPFTVLVLLHILLHWRLGRILEQPSRLFWYILIQGVLVLVISAYAKNIAMIFALYMGLIGEAVGLFRLTRQGVLVGGFFLVLMGVNLVQLSGWESSRLLLLGTIPIVAFVVIYVNLYMRQNEARERALSLAAELESTNRQLSEYAARVEDLTISNERQRMARDLHDTLSQGLAGLILQLEAADAQLNNQNSEKARSIVANAMLQARATLADARSVIDDLRQSPPADLDAALRLETTRFTKATGIPCSCHWERIPPLPENLKETVIRFVAEALTNITKYARARQVTVRVEMNAHQLKARVQDDGRGFDAASIPAGHYGLVGIKERVRLANGRFEIDSRIGTGTTLSIELPL